MNISKNNKDKLDKHLLGLTKQLIKLHFIDEDDLSIYRYDDLFKELLCDEQYEYRDIIKAVSYTASKIKHNGYKDEYGRDIRYLFAYFQSSLISNLYRITTTIDIDWLQ